MDKPEQRMSEYIDALNAEQEPEKHYGPAESPELQELLVTARLLHSLKEPQLPDSDYPGQLAQGIADALQANKIAEGKPKEADYQPVRQKTRRYWPRPVLAALTAVAAGLCLFAILFNWTNWFNSDVVYAMEKAVTQLSSYHGVLEMRSQNEAGEDWMVRRAELWWEGDKYAMELGDGTMTVNNNEQKWQINHNNKEVSLLPVAPDPTRNSFDLRDEAKRAKEYPHSIAGQEMIANRQAIKLQISPPGGKDYYLWIDEQTNLPVQLQTAMQNGLQTTYTFVSFEPNIPINTGIFTFQVPAGYKVVEKDPGQLAATLEEAAAISGFIPLFPQENPSRIIAFNNRIVLDYGDTTIEQQPAKGSLEPAANSALGTAAGGRLEVGRESLRWHQNGLEIRVVGPRRVELARQITADLTLPDHSSDLAAQAQVKVPVDLDIVEASQQQVDRGSSPWQLDPLQVALTFVNLQVSPEGIVGEPKIQASSFKLATNNGSEAIVEVNEGPVKKVYLKRLVRQDETGIWSVVGYDPR
jgi:outer membrane lipoprotein-sorting protein